METNIGIAKTHRQTIVDELSKILADEYVLYTKTRNAHWNVVGIDFQAKHGVFESQYRQLDDFVDSVAERIRALGHYAPATMKSFLELTQLTEAASEKNDSRGFLKELLNDHESVVIKLRENINRFANDFHDYGTSDFLTGLMEEHEKMAWMLRSHL